VSVAGAAIRGNYQSIAVLVPLPPGPAGTCRFRAHPGVSPL